MTNLQTVEVKLNSGEFTEFVFALAAIAKQTNSTIEEVYEPFLIQEGFIVRTPRGREVTDLAYRHLGRTKSNRQGDLF